MKTSVSSSSTLDQCVVPSQLRHLDSVKRQSLTRCKLPLESRVLYVPLNEEEEQSWLQFKETDEGNPELCIIGPKNVEEATWLIDLSHPIVPLVGRFAVDAFNELIRRFFKRLVSESLSDVEIMKVSYVKLRKYYVFHIILEAAEEGCVGVYEAMVCSHPEDGMRTLISFEHSLRQPVGLKAKLVQLKSEYIALKGEKRMLEAELARIKAEGKKQPRASAKRRNLKQAYKAKKKEYKAKKVVCRKVYRKIDRLGSLAWKTTRSDRRYWSVPSSCTGLLQRRPWDCSPGYDYVINRVPEFDLPLLLLKHSRTRITSDFKV